MVTDYNNLLTGMKYDIIKFTPSLFIFSDMHHLNMLFQQFVHLVLMEHILKSVHLRV